MKKLLLLLGIFALFLNASEVFAGSIDKIITKSAVKRGTISVSVKNISTGETVYELNPDKLVPPASTLKLVTLAASLDTLGNDYNFRTSLYKSTGNDLYIKLAADPFLTSKNLNTMFETARKKNITAPKNIYIDDYVLDSVEWGEGWQWDDELNPLMPKFGSYNLDGNILHIVVMPTGLNAPAKIYPKKFYPVSFMNMVTTGKNTDFLFEKTAPSLPDMLTVKGSVAKAEVIKIPVNNLKRYFRLRLEEAVRDNKIEFYGNIEQKKLPQSDIYLVDEVIHPVQDAVTAILKKSSNPAAETVFKLAGGKYVNNTGSVKSALEMFENFCKNMNLDTTDIKVVDGSGVSKNNLMSADFMTDFMTAISKQEDFENFKNSMATPGEGTLENRMLYFSGNLRAKTGTLSDISAIAGYITSQKGNTYAFDIMINDAKTSSSDKKMLEEYIIRSIYTEY